MFSADILQLLPVPDTDRGGSTNPNDQRAYLFVEKETKNNVRDEK